MSDTPYKQTFGRDLFLDNAELEIQFHKTYGRGPNFVSITIKDSGEECRVYIHRPETLERVIEELGVRLTKMRDSTNTE